MFSFAYKTKSWIDEDKQFHGLIKFTEISNELVGKGKLGEFSGWFVCSEVCSGLNVDKRTIYIPGSGSKEGLDDSAIEVFTVDVFNTVLKVLEEARQAINPHSDYLEDAKKAYKNMIDYGDLLIRKMKILLEEGKTEMVDLDSFKNPVDKSFDFKRRFSAVLLTSFPFHGESCAFCNHRMRKFREKVEDNPCDSCVFSLSRLNGMKCSNYQSDWSKLRQQVLELQHQIDKVYAPIGK